MGIACRSCTFATLATFLVAAAFPAGASASDTLVADLEQRLSREGAEAVNTYLSTKGSATLNSLNHSTANCELQAVSLSIRLTRGSHSKTVDAHGESLRVAVGRCTGFVLALLSPKEVPKFCASVASWTLMQTARELRRRMSAIDADAVLRSSPRGKACRAAYLYELQNTRVGLQVRPARTAPP